jgi:hypothetical protein
MIRRSLPAGLFLLVVALGSGTAAAARPDPLEGAWLGTCGTDKETIEVGFEFRRDASGKAK